MYWEKKLILSRLADHSYPTSKFLVNKYSRVMHIGCFESLGWSESYFNPAIPALCSHLSIKATTLDSGGCMVSLTIPLLRSIA